MKTIEKDLDIILEHFKNEKITQYEQVKSELNCTKDEFDAYIVYFKELGLVKPSVDDKDIWVVTVKGMLFDGFIKEKENKKTLGNVESWVKLSVISAGIGGGVTAIYYILEMFLKFFHLFCSC